MAKKTRMGRNLNALLGGATRNRPSDPADSDEGADKPATDRLSDEHSSERLSEPGPTPLRDSAQTGKSAPRVEPIAPAAKSPIAGVSSSVPAKPATDFGTRDTSTAEPPIASASPAIDSPTADSPTANSPTTETLPADSHPTDRLRMLGVDQITRGTYQPRRHFDQVLLQELADSIQAQGLIQPILVRAYGGKYELIAGERRWRASQLAGITDIPAIVRDMDDQSVAAVSLIENIQRADLNPLEEAQALERLCGEFSMTHQQVAEAVGRSRVAVTNLMRLLELHDDVKAMVDKGELDMGHARALLGAPRNDQPGIAKRITQQGLTVRAVEKLVKDLREGKTPASTVTSKTDPNIEALGQKLSKLLGSPVSIRHQKNGSGKLEISYTSIDELEGILTHIK